MTYVLGTPAGERRVTGRARLFRTLAEMSEQERRSCTVSVGGQTSRADAVYWSLAYRYGGHDDRWSQSVWQCLRPDDRRSERDCGD